MYVHPEWSRYQNTPSEDGSVCLLCLRSPEVSSLSKWGVCTPGVVWGEVCFSGALGDSDDWVSSLNLRSVLGTPFCCEHLCVHADEFCPLARVFWWVEGCTRWSAYRVCMWLCFDLPGCLVHAASLPDYEPRSQRTSLIYLSIDTSLRMYLNILDILPRPCVGSYPSTCLSRFLFHSIYICLPLSLSMTRDPPPPPPVYLYISKFFRPSFHPLLRPAPYDTLDTICRKNGSPRFSSIRWKPPCISVFLIPRFFLFLLSLSTSPCVLPEFQDLFGRRQQIRSTWRCWR